VITCGDCGLAEDLEWNTTKAGKSYLVQVRRIPHHVICPAKKNGAKPKKAKAVVTNAVAKSAKLLRDMQYTAAEAQAMLKDIPEAEPEDMVLAALTKMGAG
jgi:hypothetical protein